MFSQVLIHWVNSLGASPVFSKPATLVYKGGENDGKICPLPFKDPSKCNMSDLRVMVATVPVYT